jgi:hypothetical protein
MLRFVALAAALIVVPAGAGAEEIWRWRDAAGRLHYSNVRENVPPGAETLGGRPGRPAHDPAGERARPESDVPGPDGPRANHRRETSPRPHHALGVCELGFCPSLGSADIRL